MSETSPPSHAAVHLPFARMQDAHKHWGRLLAIGLALSAIGAAGIAASTLFTRVAVVTFGWLLVVAGVAALFHAFSAPRWTGVLLQAAMGALNVVIGTICTWQPLRGAAALTLLIAASLIAQGVFRFAAAFASNIDGRGLLLVSALVTLVLGCTIFAQWPKASEWVVGLFVGIDLLIYGSWLVSLAFAVRRPIAS